MAELSSDVPTTTVKEPRWEECPTTLRNPGEFRGNLATKVLPVSVDSGSSVLTVRELADLLRLNRKTIYAAIVRGEIPGVLKVGRVWRISRNVVLRWLDKSHG